MSSSILPWLCLWIQNWTHFLRVLSHTSRLRIKGISKSTRYLLILAHQIPTLMWGTVVYKWFILRCCCSLHSCSLPSVLAWTAVPYGVWWKELRCLPFGLMRTEWRGTLTCLHNSLDVENRVKLLSTGVISAGNTMHWHSRDFRKNLSFPAWQFISMQ